jgi:hypothetical protein
MDKTERIEAADVMRGDGPWMYRRRNHTSQWETTWTPTWDHALYEYREVSPPPPAPVICSWQAHEVPVGSVIRRKCNPGTRLLIVGVKLNDVGETCVYLGGNGAHLDAQALADEWTLWDGTPCGVMVVPGEASPEAYTEDHTT